MSINLIVLDHICLSEKYRLARGSNRRIQCFFFSNKLTSDGKYQSAMVYEYNEEIAVCSD